MPTDENSSTDSREVFKIAKFRQNICTENDMENTAAQQQPYISFKIQIGHWMTAIHPIVSRKTSLKQRGEAQHCNIFWFVSWDQISATNQRTRKIFEPRSNTRLTLLEILNQMSVEVERNKNLSQCLILEKLNCQSCLTFERLTQKTTPKNSNTVRSKKRYKLNFELIKRPKFVNKTSKQLEKFFIFDVY